MLVTSQDPHRAEALHAKLLAQLLNAGWSTRDALDELGLTHDDTLPEHVIHLPGWHCYVQRTDGTWQIMQHD